MQVLLPKELTDLEKYLATPYINPNDDSSRLFSQLCKFHPGMDSPKLTKERLFSKVCNKAPYNDGKMRKLMTQLTQLIEQYLMLKELRKSEEIQANLLARSLSDRGNYELFAEVTESRIKELDKRPERGRDYFRESYQLSEMLYFHPETDQLTKGNDYLIKAVASLEQYFTLVSLQNAADSIVRNRLVREQVSMQYLEAIKSIAGNPGFGSFSAIRFFHHLVLLLQGQAEEDLGQLKEKAFKALDELSSFEKSLGINSVRNYAIPKANDGSLPHSRFIFELYKTEIESGLMLKSISPGAFMNIASVGLALGELDWVAGFMDTFSSYLPEDEMEMTLHYCKGIWHYQKGLISNQLEDFYDANQALNLIPTRTGVKYELRVRPSLLRIHFEIFERGKETLDELLMQVKNFERHLNGSDVYAQPVKAAYLNFLRFFKILARLVNRPDLKQTSVESFLKQMRLEEGTIVARQWLEDKGKGLIIND